MDSSAILERAVDDKKPSSSEGMKYSLYKGFSMLLMMELRKSEAKKAAIPKPLDDADVVLKGIKSQVQEAGIASYTPAVTEKAVSFRIYLSDHQHTVRCPFLNFVPPGSTLGPEYLVKYDVCGYEQL